MLDYIALTTISVILLFSGCVKVTSPASEWYKYTDENKRNHIYNINIEELSQTGENVTEYYYCLEHETLEEIKIIWPPQQDSSLIAPSL